MLEPSGVWWGAALVWHVLIQTGLGLCVLYCAVLDSGGMCWALLGSVELCKAVLCCGLGVCI